MKKKTYRLNWKGLTKCILLGCVLLAGACLPEFRNGLPRDPGVQTYDRLAGSWYCVTENDRQELSIYPRKSGWVDIVYVYDIESSTSRDGINVLVFEGYSVTLGEDRLMCFRLRKKDFGKTKADSDPKQFSFLMARYSMPDEEELIIENFSVEKVKRLVDEGKLEGEVFERAPAEGRFFPGVVVTSPSEKLGTVISEQGVEEFIGDGPYGRMTFLRKR